MRVRPLLRMVWHENRESAALSASAQPSPPAAVAVIVRAHARDFRLLRVAIPPVVLSRIMRDTRSFFVLFFVSLSYLGSTQMRLPWPSVRMAHSCASMRDAKLMRRSRDARFLSARYGPAALREREHVCEICLNKYETCRTSSSMYTYVRCQEGLSEGH